MAFKSLEEVQRWAAERQDPELTMRTGLAQGNWNDNVSVALVKEWIHRAEQGRVAAAEAAALAAANRSADAADRSAKWAGWAVVVSIAALFLSGWPYIKQFTE